MWLLIKLFIGWGSRALSVAEFDTDKTRDTILVLADSHGDLCCFRSFMLFGQQVLFCLPTSTVSFHRQQPQRAQWQ